MANPKRGRDDNIDHARRPRRSMFQYCLMAKSDFVIPLWDPEPTAIGYRQAPTKASCIFQLIAPILYFFSLLT